MADTTIKRWNESANSGNGAWEAVYPETTVSQIIATGDRDSGSFLRGDGVFSDTLTDRINFDGGLKAGSTANNIAPINVKSYSNVRAIHIEEHTGSESWQLGVNSDGDLNFFDSGSSTPDVIFKDGGETIIANSFSSDGNGKFYAWRAVDNTSSGGAGYYRIANISGSQSTRFQIEVTGRSQGYGDGNLPNFGKIIGQLNNDNNYDVWFFNNSTGTSEPIQEVGTVDDGTTGVNIWIKVSSFSEVAATAVITDGNITVYDTNSLTSTAPTGYTAVGAEYKMWNSGNDGTDSGLAADKLDGQHGSYYLDYNNFTNTPTISTNADTLDSLNSTQFLRSDADDNYNGVLSLGSTSTIKLPNSAQYGIRTSTGHRVIDSVDATLRIGDTGKHSLITLHGQDGDDFKVYYGATHYTIYHEGNKPSAGDVGAAAASHTHSISDVTNLQTTLNAKQESFGDVSSNPPANGQVLKWNSTNAEWTPSDDNNNTYNAGGGITLSGSTFTHSDTSSQASVNNSGATFIQDVTLDTYGHVTGLTSSSITNNVSGATFQNAYAAPGGGTNTGVLLYGDYYGWHTRSIGSQGQVLKVGSLGTPVWENDTGNWTEIKTGTTSVTGATVTNMTLSSAIDDTSVIAFELNTSSATSITSQVHIVKIENSSSVYGGVLYNAYAASTLIRPGSIRVYRGANTTTLSFSYAYYFTNGSSSESSDTVYIGKIWKLNNRTGV